MIFNINITINLNLSDLTYLTYLIGLIIHHLDWNTIINFFTTLF